MRNFMDVDINKDSETDKSTEPEPKSDNKFRRYISWLIVIGTAISGTYFLGFLVYYSLGMNSSTQNWLIRVIENHYAATIGVPLSAISPFVWCFC